MKKLCPIHYYYYEGSECPLCMQERMQKMSTRFYQNDSVEKDETAGNEEITEDLLNKLKEKFDSH